MRRTRPAWRFLLVALAANLLLAGSVGGGRAYACSCAATGTPSERAAEDLRKADAVFSGEAREINVAASPPGRSDPTGGISFTVEKTWKGARAGQLTVYGQGDGASCSTQFREGGRYLVYAYRGFRGEDDWLETGSCDSTQALSGAEVYPETLGPPPAGLPETGGVAPPGAAWREGALLVALLLASLGAGALHLSQRRHTGPRWPGESTEG